MCHLWGKTEDVTVAKHSDKSDGALREARSPGKHQLPPCPAGQGAASAFSLGAMERSRGVKPKNGSAMCLFLKHPGCSTFHAKWEGARINHHCGSSVVMLMRGRGGSLDQGCGSEYRER